MTKAKKKSENYENIFVHLSAIILYIFIMPTRHFVIISCRKSVYDTPSSAYTTSSECVRGVRVRVPMEFYFTGHSPV